jgi:CubicO group peptidase (beta-lactamase class C family)
VTQAVNGLSCATALSDWHQASNLWEVFSSAAAFVPVPAEDRYYPLIYESCDSLIRCNERFAKIAIWGSTALQSTLACDEPGGSQGKHEGIMKFDQNVQEQVADLFRSYDKPDWPGFAVGIVCNSQIVFCEGFGQATLEHFSPITSATIFDVGSMAKQFVGMSIALLEEDGQLSPSDKMHKYLAEFPDYAKEITLADLLYHTSGIRNYTVLAYYLMGYHESDAMTREEVYDLLLTLPSLHFKPGERWEYSDSNYFLLAQIVERITGKSFGEYAREAIFDPLDMHHTLFRECHSQVIRNRAMSYVTYPIAFRSPYLHLDRREGPGVFHTLVSNYEHVGAEGLFTSLEDLLKWIMNFQENRLGRNSSDLIARILAPGVQVEEDIGYGFGINVGKFKGKKFHGHDGAIHAYTSSMMHFPEENVSIICLANHNLEGAWEYRDRIMDLIFPGSGSIVSPHQPPHHREADPEGRLIAGSYQNPRTAAIWQVACRDQGVFIRENDNWEFEISRVEPFIYRVARPAMELRFVIDSGGKVREIEGIAGEQSFTFVPFLQKPPCSDELVEYMGEYGSRELGITFIVEPAGQRLIVRNKAKHFCSMDLLYTPTIKDSFIAYDPHPKSSQITFLRKEGSIEAFVFRDYDGDGREDMRFVKME